MEVLDNRTENKKIDAKAATMSIVLYSALILGLYFLKLTYQPPKEEFLFGVDLNYGTDLIGHGDIQTTNKANDSKNAYDVAPKEATKKIKEEVPPPAPKPQPKAPPVKSTPAKVLTSNDNTKVTVKKTEEQPKSTPQPKAAPAEKPTPKVETPPTPARTVDNGSLMGKPASSGGSTTGGGVNGTTGTRSGVGGNNNGDGKPGEVGDKGSPDGKPDGNSLYGRPGTGGGTSSGNTVNISGWTNTGALKIARDNSSETGTIIFDVTLNENGDVVSIINRKTNFSPSVIAFYKQQVSANLKKSLKAEGTPPSRSKGTITIRISRG